MLFERFCRRPNCARDKNGSWNPVSREQAAMGVPLVHRNTTLHRLDKKGPWNPVSMQRAGGYGGASSTCVLIACTQNVTTIGVIQHCIDWT